MPASFSTFLALMVENPALTVSVLLTLAVLVVNGWTDAPNAIAGVVVTGGLPFRGRWPWLRCAIFWGCCALRLRTLRWWRPSIPLPPSAVGPRRPPWPCAPPWEQWSCGRRRPGGGGSPPARATPWRQDCRGQRWLLRGALPASAGRGGGGAAGADPVRGRRTVGGTADGADNPELAPVPKTVPIVPDPGGGRNRIFPRGSGWAEVYWCVPSGGGPSPGAAGGPDSPGPALADGAVRRHHGGRDCHRGRRIIDTVGREMVTLGPREGFSADLAGILCLFAATLLGLPVSTTHTRTAALLGWGLQDRGARTGRWSDPSCWPGWLHFRGV